MTVGKPSQNQLGTLSYLPWIGFDEVLAGSPWAMPPRKRAAFYAQSWLLTHYLLRDEARWASTVAYFRALRTGMSAGDAWARHVSISIDGLRSELTRFANRSMQYGILTTALPEPVINITALPKSADRLTLPAIGIAFGSAAQSSISALLN